MILWRLASAGLFLCLGAEARAVIFYSSGNDHNTSSPGGGLPWDNVVEIRSNSGIAGSGVYLGNRYVLTAAHVGPTEVVRINATDFTLESAAPIQIGTADMKLLRLQSDPGLGNVLLNTNAANDSGEAFLVGYGVGRSMSSPTETNLVMWGDNSTARKRWGYNEVDFAVSALAYTNNSITYTSPALVTQFNSDGNLNEAAMTLYDSGSALFRLVDSNWLLVGLGVAVATYDESFASPTAISDEESNDNNYFVRISSYAEAQDILGGVVVPEPGTGHLLILALGIYSMLQRRTS